MKLSKRDKLIDGIVFLVLLVTVSAVMLVLFYRQTIGNPELYHSDMKAYILEMQGLDSGYEFPYPVFFKLSALIHLFVGPELAVAIATMLLNSLSIILTKLAFNYFVFEKENVKLFAGVSVSLIAISLFFVSMLFPPSGIYLPGIKHNYLGVFTPNPFHNATYMAARPFSILAFLWFVKLLPVYEGGLRKAPHAQGTNIVDYIGFSVFLLLATMTKPSFTLVLVSTAGLIMLYRMIRSGFRNFVPTVQLGITFIPTFVDLLYQFKGVFVPVEGAEGGVGFGFGEVWSQYCDNLPLAVCLAVGFPLVVLVLNFKDCRKNTMFLFSWQMYWMSFVEAFFLYEKGFRKNDFNFSWGYICGIFFCHFSALVVLMKATKRLLDSEEKERLKVMMIGVQWFAYLCHVICGLRYFAKIFGGGMYY